mmetsp:Transcript_22215/g.40029  ORF Transcript_22215/g.40029 Transcript_22215/m.40029 type:complete len:177 (-) Transcript_22215:94-624(-)
MVSRRVVASIGWVLALYSLYVEDKVAHRNDPSFDSPEEEPFKALCDIEAIGASCSAVFALPEGKLLSFLGVVPQGHALDVPNAFLGLLYYSLVLLFGSSYFTTFMGYYSSMIMKLVSLAAMTTSVFLAYKLTTLRELCILCWTTHAINLYLVISYHCIQPKPSRPAVVLTSKNKTS